MASVQLIAGEPWDFSDWERGSYEEPHQMISCRLVSGCEIRRRQKYDSRCGDWSCISP